MRALLEKVCGVHGQNHPELLAIRDTFFGLAMHLMKEENVLFPYIVRMEKAVVQNDPVVPAPFGTVQNPVRMMMQEHDGAGEALRQIRRHQHIISYGHDTSNVGQRTFQVRTGRRARSARSVVDRDQNFLFLFYEVRRSAEHECLPSLLGITGSFARPQSQSS